MSDVCVIGGGPVGMGLAIDLAQRDISVTIVEKYTQSQSIPKGQNITQRGGEHFQAWDISQNIRAASPIPPDYGNEGLIAYGSLLSGYHYDWFKRASVGEFYSAENERLPQYETERVLRERTWTLPQINWLTGWSHVSHEITHSGVSTIVEQTTDGSIETRNSKTINSRFLVGCDGSRSSVRQAAGLTETTETSQRRMVLLVFNSTELNDLLETHFPRKTIFNALHPDYQGYWQFLGRVDLQGNWFFHAPVENSATAENLDCETLLQQAVGADFSMHLEHVGFWNARFSHADTYRKGPVFVAGDAAHSHPPYGGYGINLGFEDARNLAWKLAAFLQGWGSDALLDSYSLERHPVFAATRDDFIGRMIENDREFTKRFDPVKNPDAFKNAWQQRSKGGQKEVQDYVPNYEGSSFVWPQASASHTRSGASVSVKSPPVQTYANSAAAAKHTHRAIAGFHLSPASNSQITSQRADGFILIAIDLAPALVEDFRQAASSLNIPLQVVDDLDTAVAEHWQASLVLIRPDYFVTCAFSDTAQLQQLQPREILYRAIQGCNKTVYGSVNSSKQTS